SYFLVEMYRLKDNRIRVRMIANRSLFNITPSLNVSTNDLITGGFGFLLSPIQRLFDCSPLSFAASTNLFEKTPVDSMMSDYVFDLNQKEGVSAFGFLIKELTDLDYLKYLNFIYDHKKLSESLNSLLEKTDESFHQQKHIAPEKRAIHRLFKGRTITNYKSIDLNSKCLRIWNLNLFSIRNAASDIRSFDENEVPRDYNYYSSATNNKLTYISDLYGEGQQFSANALFNGVRLGNKKDQIKVTPLNLNDLIITRQFKTLDYTRKDLVKIKNYLNYTTPDYSKEIQWGKFEDSGKRQNAYFFVRWVFDPDFVTQIDNELKQNPFLTLSSRLENYLNHFPNKSYLPAPNENDHMRQSWHGKFDMDIQIISQDLTVAIEMIPQDSTDIVRRQVMEKKVQAFRNLQSNELFQHIGPGFLISLLPKDQVKNFVNFRLIAGARKTEPLNFERGAPGPTEIYSSIEYILASIQDREFDVRLQLNENGAYYNCLYLDPKEQLNCNKK
nr:hypothetical protein [Pseudobdellovibrionaceae bacterium]